MFAGCGFPELDTSESQSKSLVHAVSARLSQCMKRTSRCRLCLICKSWKWRAVLYFSRRVSTSQTDLVLTLLETVVDFQQRTTAVENCVNYFTNHRWNEVRTLDNVVSLFARFPNDNVGNIALAQYLSGYRLWTRAEQLRGLVAFFADNGIEDLDGLRNWAAATTFKTFEGRVKGLGFVLYHWLVMRLGVPTVKPDVHVLRFCQAALSRVVREQDAISGLTTVAGQLGVPPHRLDWSIWEYQRGGGT